MLSICLKTGFIISIHFENVFYYFFPFGTTAGPYTPQTPNLSADISAGGAQGPEYLGHIWPSLRHLN